MNSRSAQRFVFHGALLFLLGLLTGFVVPGAANPRMGLSAHLEGVMNGTFLLALGAVWSHVSLPARFETAGALAVALRRVRELGGGAARRAHRREPLDADRGRRAHGTRVGGGARRVRTGEHLVRDGRRRRAGAVGRGARAAELSALQETAKAIHHECAARRRRGCGPAARSRSDRNSDRNSSWAGASGARSGMVACPRRQFLRENAAIGQSDRQPLLLIDCRAELTAVQPEERSPWPRGQCACCRSMNGWPCSERERRPSRRGSRRDLAGRTLPWAARGRLRAR